MEKQVNIAMLQMSSVTGDVEANMTKVKRLIQNNLPDIDFKIY